MLYLEDEDNVRASWMPYKNDYRHLDIEELATIEDCDDATLWLNDRITDMYAWIETKTDPEDVRRFRRHISRALYLKKRVGLLRSDFWQEEKREFWASKPEVSANANGQQLTLDERVAKRTARAEAHAALMAQHDAARPLRQAERLARIEASTSEQRQFIDNFRQLFIDRYGRETWLEMAREARKQVDQASDEESGDAE